MVCLGNRDHSIVFEIVSKYCILDSFVDYDGYSISSKGFLSTVVDLMVIWVKSPIPVHLSSLVPRMSTFTLAISCLTTSNLPWFMDLTFQVPMQYCSLQHWTLLLSPVPSTTATDCAEAWPWGATLRPRSEVATESARLQQRRSSGPEELPTPEVRGSSSLEELPHPRGQRPCPRGATPPPKSGCFTGQGCREELLHVQGQEGRPWGDSPHPR